MAKVRTNIDTMNIHEHFKVQNWEGYRDSDCVSSEIESVYLNQPLILRI